MTATEILELPFLKVIYRKDLNVLIGRWANAVTSEQLYEGYTHTLSLAKEYNVSLWLMDMRMRNVSNQTEKDWFFRNIVPAISENVKPTFIAYLTLPNQLVKFGDFYPTQKAFSFSQQLQASFFVNEKNAFDWLKTCANCLSAA